MDINYDGGDFILSSAFFGNADMITILKNHKVNIHIQNDKPYRLAVQNNDVDCIKILC